MVAASRLIRPPPPHLDGLTGRMRWNETVTAIADEVRPTALEQGLPHLKVVLRLKKLHKGPLQLAIVQVAGHVHLLLRKRIDPRVVHARGNVGSDGVKPFAVTVSGHRALEHRNRQKEVCRPLLSRPNVVQEPHR